MKSLFKNRSLMMQFVRRDVAAQYRGSMFGVLWSLFIPLLMLAVYSFVFTIVFKARFATESSVDGDFAVILFSGLIIHSLFIDSINKAPTLITANVNLVKKVIFPLEILAPATIITSLYQFFINCAVLMLGVILIFKEVHLTILLAPFIIFPLLLLTNGICWFLCAIGVYVRDIAHILPIISTVLLFMSTIFYPASSLPDNLQSLIYLNPLSFIVDQFREVVLYGNIPDIMGIITYYIIGIVAFFMGALFFSKTRNGFADV